MSVAPPPEPTPWALGLLVVATALALFSACLLVGINGLIGGIRWWLGWIATAVVGRHRVDAVGPTAAAGLAVAGRRQLRGTARRARGRRGTHLRSALTFIPN